MIYIDQFAISNMMKAIDVTAEAHGRTVADPFWLTLFAHLERVCKLQLVVCPYSDDHRDESLAWGPFFERAKRMYEHLSHGVSFQSAERIFQKQLNTAVSAWVRGNRPAHNFDPTVVTSGGLHDWQGRFLVSVAMTYPSERVAPPSRPSQAVGAG